MKDFDLEEAKKGKPVCTMDGHKVRIICFDGKTIFGNSIVALITDESGYEEVLTYHPNGRFYSDGTDSNLDLMMAEEKKDGWVNLYRCHNVILPSKVYETENKAMEDIRGENYISTIKIKWEE